MEKSAKSCYDTDNSFQRINAMKKRLKTDFKVFMTASLLLLSLLLSGCIFGGAESSTPAQEGTSASETQASQPEGTTAAPETTTEAPPAPVTIEMVAADLSEAFEALTGKEGAASAHLLGAGDQPLEDFAYQGGAAIMAPYVKIETLSVTGEGDGAQAVLSITSPDLWPLIEKAVAGMESLDEEAMNKNLASLLKKGGYEKTVHEVTVELKNIDGVWYIRQNEELQNALSGGLLALEKEAAPTAGGKN